MRRVLQATLVGCLTLAAAACGPMNKDAPEPAKAPDGAYKTGGYNRSNPNPPKPGDEKKDDGKPEGEKKDGQPEGEKK